MSNRRLNPKTGKKEYIPRDQRRAERAERRAAAGAPPERRVGPSGKSYLGKVETFEPDTGDVIEPAHDAPADNGTGSMFLIEGTRYVYENLGGHRAYLKWAKEHEGAFRALAMKLLPAQVTVMQANLVGEVTIVHALAAPGYNPSNPPVEPPTSSPDVPEQPKVTLLEARKGKLNR